MTVLSRKPGGSGGGGAPSGPAGGSLGGTYPNPSIAAGAVDTTELANDSVDADKLDGADAADIRTLLGVPSLTGSFVWDEVITRNASKDMTSDTTLANDGVLQFAVVNGSTYFFELLLVYSEPAGASAADIKAAFAVSGGASFGSAHIMRSYINTGAASVFSAYTDPTTVLAANTNGAEERMIHLNGWMAFATSNGTVALQWAQNTSSVNATRVHATSSLKYKQMT